MTFDFNAESARHPEAVRSPAASERQIEFARRIALRQRITLPDAVLGDRARLSSWIAAHKDRSAPAQAWDAYPSSRQVAFAERIARMRRRAVPAECFKDRKLMSRWIDSNR